MVEASIHALPVRGVVLVLAAAAGALGYAAPARANTPDDVQGLGARANAMGGAGTAIAEDFAATYYAPANLAYCRESSLTLGLRHTHYDLQLDGAPDDPEAAELRDQTRIVVGVCNRLPYGFALGIVFSTGLQNAMTLDQSTLDSQPRYLLYGDPLEQLTIQLGLAYRIVEQVSIGIGVSVLVSSALALDASIPVASAADESVYTRIQWQLSPAASLVAGVHVRPIEGLRLALNYRSALFHDLDAPANIEVALADSVLEVPLLIEGATWYSPQQVAFGMSYILFERLTLAADVTWQDWSKHPGPFLIVTAQDLPDPSVADLLMYPPREQYGFRDAVVPRVGVELRVLESRALALRAGYGYRSAIAPIPTQISNLLDGPVHSVSAGLGYDFGDDPDAPEQDIAIVQSDGDAEQASLDAPGPYVRGVDGRLSAFVRVAHMKTQQVVRPEQVGQPLSDYTFGGNVVDAGIELSLGWF